MASEILQKEFLKLNKVLSQREKRRAVILNRMLKIWQLLERLKNVDPNEGSAK